MATCAFLLLNGTMAASAQAPLAGSPARVVMLAADSASASTVERLVPLIVARLRGLKSAARVQVLSSMDVGRSFGVELPPLATLSIADRLELGKQLNAAVLDLHVQTASANEIVLVPTLRMQGLADGVRWSPFAVKSVQQLAEYLARQIAADRTLRRPTVGTLGCPTAPLFEFQVDHPAAFVDDPSLDIHPVQGAYDGSLIQFVVDSSGRPEPGSFKPLKVEADSVRQTLRDMFIRWHFVPARLGRCHVRQLVHVVVSR